MQNKVHPRERDPKDLKFRGRVRVQLKNDDGTPVMEQFPTSKRLTQNMFFIRVIAHQSKI